MSQHQSSSCCNLTLEQSDMKKLQELDPFQTDGFQSFDKVTIPINIVYTNEKGKQTSDSQQLTLQVLTRTLRPAVTKATAKVEPQLDAMRVCLMSQDDIFLSMVSTISNSTFEALKTKNGLNIQFKDFPQSLAGMFKNCSGQSNQGQNSACLRLSYEGTGRLIVSQHTEYKEIELVELHFSGSSLEKAHQSIIYRYNYNRTKLVMIENTVDSVYKLLAAKNPPLLAYIQKTIGDA